MLFGVAVDKAPVRGNGNDNGNGNGNGNSNGNSINAEDAEGRRTRRKGAPHSLTFAAERGILLGP